MRVRACVLQRANRFQKRLDLKTFPFSILARPLIVSTVPWVYLLHAWSLTFETAIRENRCALLHRGPSASARRPRGERTPSSSRSPAPCTLAARTSSGSRDGAGAGPGTRALLEIRATRESLLLKARGLLQGGRQEAGVLLPVAAVWVNRVAAAVPLATAITVWRFLLVGVSWPRPLSPLPVVAARCPTSALRALRREVITARCSLAVAAAAVGAAARRGRTEGGC